MNNQEIPTILISQPEGSFLVRPNRAIRLSYDTKSIEVWENQSRPGWGEHWIQVASIIAQEGEQQWFQHDDLPGDSWVALAYFWTDIGK